MSGLLNAEQCQAVLEGLPNGVYVVDRERKILFWNKGAEQITGYRGQDVVGRHCQDNLLMHCDENYNGLCGDGCPLKETMFDGRPRDNIGAQEGNDAALASVYGSLKHGDPLYRVMGQKI